VVDDIGLELDLLGSVAPGAKGAENQYPRRAPSLDDPSGSLLAVAWNVGA
jgi:hypothetical protein